MLNKPKRLPTLLRKALKPISVRFALRSPKKGQPYANPHPLEVWITVNGQRVHFGAVWPLNELATPIRVNPAEWQTDRQASTRRTDPINRQLTAVKAHIEAIYDRQIDMGAIPELESVRWELLTGQMPKWTGTEWDFDAKPVTGATSGNSSVIDGYTAYIAHLESRAGTPAELSPITLGRWKRGLVLLTAFLAETGETMPLNRVTIGWAKRYHQWLQTIKPGPHDLIPLAIGQATRFLGKLSTVLQWAYEEEWIDKNPIVNVEWGYGVTKEVLSLEPHHVHQLLQTRWEGVEGAALWWFCLMCCTGLDYPDAIDYAHNRSAYEVNRVGGRMIVGKRRKPPHVDYCIPLLTEVEALFGIYPTGPVYHSADCVNQHTGRIEQLLGVNWRITAKTARKTFGAMVLAAGFRIDEVSRILGHSSIRTTEKHYVKTTELTVQRAMLRVEGISVARLSQPFGLPDSTTPTPARYLNGQKGGASHA